MRSSDRWAGLVSLSDRWAGLGLLFEWPDERGGVVGILSVLLGSRPLITLIIHGAEGSDEENGWEAFSPFYSVITLTIHGTECSDDENDCEAGLTCA